MIVLDVAGLYDDELFADDVTATAAAGFRALAATGTRFEDCWTESRDWPVTEYQMLAGGYPVAPFVAAAEDDPTVTFPPGQGLLAMPPPANHVANPDGAAAWRAPAVFAGGSLFDAAAARGLTTAFIGDGRLSPPARQSTGDGGRRRRDAERSVPSSARWRRPIRAASWRWWRSAGPEPPTATPARPKTSCRRWRPPPRTSCRACRARW